MELISREDAIEAIEGICNTPCNQYFINAVKRIPTIEERKEGTWIILEEPKEGRPKRWRVICPICRKTLRIADRELWEFCPRCGARTKGE